MKKCSLICTPGIIWTHKESSWAKKALKRIAQIEHIIPTDNSDYLLALLEKSISQGHDADDLVRHAIDGNLSSHHVGLAAEVALPQPVAEDEVPA